MKAWLLYLHQTAHPQTSALDKPLPSSQPANWSVSLAAAFSSIARVFRELLVSWRQAMGCVTARILVWLPRETVDNFCVCVLVFAGQLKVHQRAVSTMRVWVFVLGHLCLSLFGRGACVFGYLRMLVSRVRLHLGGSQPRGCV